MNILLDTDIGDDIDDALALALALNMKEINLVGVTTVFKDTNLRGRIAKKILGIANRPDIPVYAGCGNGIQQKNNVNEDICQYTPDLDLERYAPLNNREGAQGQSAVDFIIQAAEQYAGDLTLVGIGPLTNIAKAYLQAPESMSKVGNVVIMGGTFYQHHREWNILCDVEAAQIVFDSCTNLHCVGFDVTQKVQLNRSEHEFILGIHNHELTGYLAEIMRLWSKSSWREPLLHDPLAIYYCVHPEVLLMENILVHVETQGGYARGMTLNIDSFNEHIARPVSGKRIQAAKDVNVKLFKDYFMNTVFQY
ncbi:MAG: nucleoside hydrolase [Clostridiales bacterium]|nr:nucleoside hydrolase [Clostridiales bacterium]